MPRAGVRFRWPRCNCIVTELAVRGGRGRQESMIYRYIYIYLYIIGKGKSLFAKRKPPISHSQNNNREFSSLN